MLPLVGIGSAATRALAQSAPQTTPLPDRVDNSHLFPPVKDQGDRNTCAAFVVAATAEAAIMRDSGRRVVLSEEYLIHKMFARSEPPYSEAMDCGQVIEVAQISGFALEADWPYQPQLLANGKPCTAPGQPGSECPPPSTAQAAPEPVCDKPSAPPSWIDEKAARLRVDGWAFSQEVYGTWNTNARGEVRLQDVMRRLTVNGGGLIATIKQAACSEGWADDGTITVPASLRGMSREALEEVPNHFVVLTGYDVARREFYFRNCWGKDWGRGGYGTISFETYITPIVTGSLLSVRKGTAV